MSAPKRIRLRRTKGWRKPDGVIVVSRPTRFGNPYVVGAELSSAPWQDRAGPHPDRVLDAAHAIALYRSWIVDGATLPKTRFGPRGHAKFIEDIYDVLPGHDLACWCSLDQPCHADLLIELANRLNDTAI